jgi:6-phosphogluconolactonase
MAFHPTLDVAYALSEESSGTVSAYRISNGALTLINTASSAGQGPAHLSVHPSGKYVYTANYGNGNVGVINIGANGALGSVKTVTGGANAHMAVSDPSGKYLFVPCKGANQIAQFVVQADGSLVRNSPGNLATANGAGPRHIDFHPTRNNAYLINELSNTVQTLVFNPTTGTLSSIQTLSSLPPTFSGYSSGAEIKVAPNGKFVYVSNRGHNSIGIFSIKTDGTLQAVKWETTDINTPRAFTIDPTGKYLVVANQGSNSITGFNINADGTLTRQYTRSSITQPSFVQVWQSPATLTPTSAAAASSQPRVSATTRQQSGVRASTANADTSDIEATNEIATSNTQTEEDTTGAAAQWIALMPCIAFLLLML